MKKVFIATSREVGKKCIAWAAANTPPGFELVGEISDADIIMSVLYNKVFSSEFIKNKACFNFHAGILPEYRGTGYFSWAIINEERKAGITLHLMDRGLDTGDIIEIRQFLISEKDTAYSLFLKGQEVIFKMFKDWYIDLLNGKYEAVPQKRNEGKLYFKKDLQKVKNLTKFVKAFYFPNKESAFYFNDKNEKIYLNFKQEKQ